MDGGHCALGSSVVRNLFCNTAAVVRGVHVCMHGHAYLASILIFKTSNVKQVYVCMHIDACVGFIVSRVYGWG